jgi:hypothetical protein
MGVLLKCELSMGTPAGDNQAQYPEVAPELECCQYGQTFLFASGANPIFHHKFSIAGHPDYQIT